MSERLCEQHLEFGALLDVKLAGFIAQCHKSLRNDVLVACMLLGCIMGPNFGDYDSKTVASRQVQQPNPRWRAQ